MKVRDEGLHVIPPWDRLTPYEVRLKQSSIHFKVLSDEGLSLGVQVVVRYRPQEDMLGYLQRDIGPEYFERLIRPEVEAHIRRTFGGRPAHEIRQRRCPLPRRLPATRRGKSLSFESWRSPTFSSRDRPVTYPNRSFLLR